MNRFGSRRELRAGVPIPLTIAILAAMVGCMAPAAQESQRPSATLAASISPTKASTPTASPSTQSTTSPTAEPSDTASPTREPSAINGFRYSDILQVEVNGLAVRAAPSLTAVLAQGYRSDDGTAVQPTGDVRLDAGYFVSVDLGPLRHGGIDWYLVWPAVDARLHFNPGTWWDSNGDVATVGGVDPGWVATSFGEDQYLTLYRSTDPSEYGAWPAGGPMTLMVSGTGDYVSEPQVHHDRFQLGWAAALDEQPGPCSFSVTLVPDDGAEPIVAIETSIADVDAGLAAGPASVIDTPWGAADGESGSTLFTVSVRSDCTWALKLTPLPHD